MNELLKYTPKKLTRRERRALAKQAAQSNTPHESIIKPLYRPLSPTLQTVLTRGVKQ
jgi:hypothetical protein